MGLLVVGMRARTRGKLSVAAVVQASPASICGGGVDNAVGLVADGGWNGVVGAEGNTGIGVAGVAAAAGLRTGAGTGTGACIPGLRCGRAGGAAAMIVDRLAALCWYSCAFAEDG